MRPSDHPVVGHIQPRQNFKILRNCKRRGEMDEVEGGLGRFLAKADQDLEFLAKADRDRYLAVSFFGREFLAKADRDRYLAFFWKRIKLFCIHSFNGRRGVEFICLNLHCIRLFTSSPIICRISLYLYLYLFS